MEILMMSSSVQKDILKPYSLLMIDLDYFKHYDDTYGHLEGDNVLKCVSHVFRIVLEKQDIIARYGGEEFV
jgi:diguanylate cyclase (GGDEF)-like protein